MLVYKKKLLHFMLYGYGGLMILLVALLTGSMLLESDVLYQNGFWDNAVDIVITIFDVFAFAISAAVLVYGIYLLGARELSTVYAAYLCVTVFHYVAVLCIGWLVFPGTLPESVGDLLLYLVEDVLVFTLIDCLRLFIIGIVTAKLLAKREAARKEYNRKARILGEEMQDSRSIVFPFAKFVSLKNPVHIGLIAMALIYWLTFYIQYVYYDIITLIKLDYLYGLSLQIVNLLVNAVLAAICYCIAAFILIKLDEKMPKIE